MSAIPALLLLACAAALAPAAAAQQPPAAPAPAQEVEEPLWQLARQLRARDLSADGRDALAARLLDRGAQGATRLFDAARDELDERGKELARQGDRLCRDAARQTRRLLRELRGDRRELDAMRDEARAITRSQDLDKERIRRELDPLLATLTARTLPDPAAVLASDEELAARDAALRAADRDLQHWYQIYLRARDALDATEDGRRHVDRAGEAAPPADLATCYEGPLELAVLVAAAPDRDARALEDNVAPAAALDPEERSGIRALNRIRLALGLPVLRIDPRLCAASRSHSEDMREHGFFSHTSPVPGKQTFGQRAALAGTSASAENIARGQRTGAGAIRAWWYSPGHHRNMLGGHGRVGLGRADTFWTQMFGG